MTRWTVIGIVREEEDIRALDFLSRRPEAAAGHTICRAHIQLPPLPKDPLAKRVSRKLRREVVAPRTRLDVGFKSAMKMIDGSDEPVLIVAVGGWAEQLAWRITQERPAVLAVQGPEIAARILDAGGDPRADKVSARALDVDLIASVLQTALPAAKLLIGPYNDNGQAARWANVMGDAVSVSVRPLQSIVDYPADLMATPADLESETVRELINAAKRNASHVLLEATRTDGSEHTQLIDELLGLGKTVGIVCNEGSEPLIASSIKRGIWVASSDRAIAKRNNIPWLPFIAPKAAFAVPANESGSEPKVGTLHALPPALWPAALSLMDTVVTGSEYETVVASAAGRLGSHARDMATTYHDGRASAEVLRHFVSA